MVYGKAKHVSPSRPRPWQNLFLFRILLVLFHQLFCSGHDTLARCTEDQDWLVDGVLLQDAVQFVIKVAREHKVVLILLASYTIYMAG